MIGEWDRERERERERVRERGREKERVRKQEGTLFLVFSNIVINNMYHEGCHYL